jgi:hypothetical protein
MALTKVTYSMIDGPQANLSDFGAVGDGTTDDTAAIQAFFDFVTTNGVIGLIPAGEYKISSPVTITINSVGFNIIGPGNQAVVFRTTSTFSGGTAAISIQGTSGICAWKIGGFDVRPSLAGTSGTATTGILIGDSTSITSKINGYESSVMANITVAGFAKCYEIIHARMIWFQSCSAWNTGFATANDCVFIWQNGGFTGDLVFDRCQFVSNYVTDNTTVNIQSNVGPYNNATGNGAIAGIKFRSCDFYSGYDSITLTVSAVALISDIWFVDGCQIDQEVNRGIFGTSLNGGSTIADIHFEGMYINKSNNGSIAFASTGTFGNVNSIFVQDCHIITSLGAAISFFGLGCADFHINNNSIVDCNIDGGAITINSNCTNFNVSNNILSEGVLNFTPYNIVFIGSGCESFVVSGNNDNDLSRVIAINDASGDVVKYIVNNPNYNPLPVTSITVSASPFTYKNISGAAQYVSIGGGTVTSLSLDGLGITPTTDNIIVIPQGSSLIVGYSSLPTMNSKGF